MRLFISYLLIILSSSLSAQSYLGLKQSNYIGALGMDIQPASIADSRYLVDVNLAGFDISAYNSYLGLNSSLLGLQKVIDDPKFQNDFQSFFTENIGDNHNIFARTDINLFSFMISPNDKIAFGLSNRFRMFVNVDGFSDEFADLMYNNIDVPSLWGKNILDDKLDLQAMAWMEYGLNYAQVLYNENDHFVKVGAKVKLLQGLGAAYMYAEDFDYSFLNEDTLALYDVDVSYGHSDNISVIESDDVMGSFGYKFQSNPGVGFDFGAVYEWRPEGYKAESNTRLKFFETAPNKYKLRAGLSVLDIGRIKYKKGGFSQDFRADIAYWNVRKIDVNNVRDWDTLMNNLFVPSAGNEEYFKMNLPTTVNVNIDYNIYKTFFVNLNTHMAFQYKRDNSKSHDVTAISVSPRWDSKHFGVTMPITYSFIDGMRLGTAFRLGPLYLGSSNMAALFKQRNSKGIDLYFGARVPILKKVKKDNSGDSSF